MMPALAVAFGVASYLVFLMSFLYAIGFVGNILVPKSIDSGAASQLATALLVDLLLLGLFAIPHSVMARPWFKGWWTRFVPSEIERSTYVLVSSLLLGLLFWRWRPVPNIVWAITNPIGRWFMHGVFWGGWAIVFVSTFLINHFDLFGLRQVCLYAAGRPYTPIAFKASGLYCYVRHPLMLGFLLAFWATPLMTTGHLLFAVATTAYIIIAVQFEERDLVRFHGEQYKAYQQQVGMLLPLPTLKKLQ
jgi:protein-S-isoprenylcysteine O-methyltransferase Ste14